MTKILILLFFLISGCANARILPNFTESSPEVASYVHEFNRIIIPNNKKALKRIKNVNMRIVNSWDTKYIGFCNPFLLNGTAEIDIDKDYYDKSTDMERQFTIFHELAHCVCYSRHTAPSGGDGLGDKFESLMFNLGIYSLAARLEDSCPSSIMHPYALPEHCMLRHYQYYMDELSNQCSGK